MATKKAATSKTTKTAKSAKTAKASRANKAVKESDRSFIVTAMLSYFLGVFGIDRFYLGYYALGALKLMTIGGFGIWALGDLILILLGRINDADGRPLAGRSKDLRLTLWIIGVLVVFGLLLSFANAVATIEQLQTME